MTATQSFFEALDAGAESRTLNKLLKSVEAEDGALSMLRCFETWTQKDEEQRPRLLQACDRIAIEKKGEIAREAALRSVTLRVVEDAERDDAVAILLARSVDSPAHLKRAVEALEGSDNVAKVIKRLVKTPEIKKDPERVAELRRQLAKLFEIEDDLDRAFFEMLKAIRKAPHETLYIDELFQLSLRTERFAEVAAVFDSLSQNESLGNDLQATYCNKLAHILERHLDKPEAALEVYERSLLLRPKSKGTRKHRKRLIETLKNKAEEEAKEQADKEHNFADQSTTAIVAMPLPDEVDDPETQTEVMISRSPSAQDEESASDASTDVSRADEAAADEASRGLPANDAPAFDASSLTAPLTPVPPNSDVEDVLTDDGLEPSQDEVMPSLEGPSINADPRLSEENAAAPEFDVASAQGAEPLDRTIPTQEIPPSSPFSDIIDDALEREKASAKIKDVDAASANDGEIIEGEDASSDAFEEEHSAEGLVESIEPSLDGAFFDDGFSAQFKSPMHLHAPIEDSHFSESDSERTAAMPPPMPFDAFDDEEHSAENDSSEEPKAALTLVKKQDEESDPSPDEGGPPPDDNFIADSSDDKGTSPKDTVEFAEGEKGASEDKVDDKENDKLEDKEDKLDDKEDKLEDKEDKLEDRENKLEDKEDDKHKAEFEEIEATAKGGRDLFAEAGTLLGADDFEASLDCAHALMKQENRGSMALRLVGHALTVAGASRHWPNDAKRLFCDETPAHPEVAFALARDLKDTLALEDAQKHSELFATAALHTQDRSAARELLSDLAHADLPEGPAFIAYSSLCDSDEEVLVLLDQAAPGLEGKALLALMLHRAELYRELGKHDEALSELRQAALEVAPDDEDLRQEAILRFEGAEVDAQKRIDFFSALSEAHAQNGALQLSLVKKLSIVAPQKAREILKPWLSDRELRRQAWEIEDLLLENEDEADATRRATQQTRIETLKDEGLDEEAETLALELLSHVADDEVADEAAALLPIFIGASSFLEAAESKVQKRDPGGLVSFLRETVSVGVDTFSAEEKIAFLERAAKVASDEENHLTARKIFEEILSLDENHPQALRACAELCEEQGDLKGAIFALEKLCAKENDASALSGLNTKLAELFERDEQLESALTRYQAATEAEADNIIAWRALARLAREQSNNALLLESLRALLVHGDNTLDRAATFDEVSALHETLEAFAAAESTAKSALDIEATSERADTWLRLLTRHIDDAELNEVFVPSNALLTEVKEHHHLLSDDLADASQRLLLLCAQGVANADLLSRYEGLLSTGDDRALALAFVSWLSITDTLAPEVAEEKRGAQLNLLLTGSEDEGERVGLLGEIFEHAAAQSDTTRATEAFEDIEKIISSDNALSLSISDRALDAMVAFFETSDNAPSFRVRALELLGERKEKDDAADCYQQAAFIAKDRAADPERARALLQRAVAASPDHESSQIALLDLEVELGYGAEAILTTENILRRERSPHKRADLLVRLADLELRVNEDAALATNHLVAAMKDDPLHVGAFEACEKVLTDGDNIRGLEQLYAGQLKLLPRDNVERRLVVLDKLAKIRRYDLRDFEGAIEALEALAALDDKAIKPREDAARLYTQLTRYQEAVEAWRNVLERDPVNADGWRALLHVYCSTKQADEAFVIAQTVANLELADRATVRVVKSVRPPFPRWPRAPKDPFAFRRTVAHLLERSPIRSVFEHAGPAAHRVFAKSLKDFGLKKRDRIPERQIPPSILMAVRTVCKLLGLSELPPLYQGERADESTPAFGVLPTREPGLVIAADVLRGGMTPERAFSLGRAMALLTEQAIVVSTLDAPRIKLVLESLVARYLPTASVMGDAESLRTVGKRMDVELFKGLSQKDQRKRALESALRDYVHARDHIHISDWIAGVGYGADRIGFLLTGDLGPAVRVLKSGAKGAQRVGARLATKELVLFTASSEYLQLRHDLGLALSKSEAMPVLEIGS